MGRMADVAMVLVVGGIGLYALYAYNNGQLDQFFSGPDDTNGGTGGGGGEDMGALCSDTNTRGCCTDNAGNTCWKGTTAKGVKVGGCQREPSAEDSCDDARNDFVDQFGQDEDEIRDTKRGLKQAGGAPGVTKAGLCKEQKGSWQGKCCSCPNVTCKNKCGAKKPKPNTGTQKAGGAPGVTKSGLCAQQKGRWQGTCCSCPNVTCKNKCGASNYASAYLGSAFNRRGPSYNYRDDFVDRRHMEFPDLDWYSQASKSPYYIGIESQERAALLKRFQSNFSSMKISIA